MPQTDESVAAVEGGYEHGIVIVQCRRRRAQCVNVEVGKVRAEEDGRGCLGQCTFKGSIHSCAEVAFALFDQIDAMAGMQRIEYRVRSIRSYADFDRPDVGIARDGDRMFEHTLGKCGCALRTQYRNQSGLGLTGYRCTGEDDHRHSAGFRRRYLVPVHRIAAHRASFSFQS